MLNKKEWNQKEIEKKWQDNSKGVNKSLFNPKKKEHLYVLEMFPYPSGQIHMGHVRNYVIGDVFARYKNLNGESVIHPFGWDSFGLPAENAARDNKVSSKEWTENNISAMEEELSFLGFAWEPSVRIYTHSSEYAKEQQKIFIYLYKKNLIYKKKSYVFWDAHDKTVLANEQVIDGKGWRSKKPVEVKEIDQWFCRISRFAKNLLDDMKMLNEWPKKVLDMQRNWIGPTDGYVLPFIINNKKVEVFLKNIDELLYQDVSIEITHNHPILKEDPSYLSLIKDKIIDSILKKNQKIKEETKIKLSCKAIHPILNCSISVFFSSAIDIYHEDGIAVLCKKNTKKPVQVLSSIQKEKYIDQYSIQKKTHYKIQDWCISRQRFWGCSIPLMFCTSCGFVPNENNMNNLIQDTHLLDEKLTCPQCHAPCNREQDTMDTFFDSSWYYIAYIKQMEKKYQIKIPFHGVDFYIGGIEHAILHLMYARFICKALKGSEYSSINEPFNRLFTQGMINHKTFKKETGEYVFPHDVYEKDNLFFHKEDNSSIICGPYEKMSKSLKNVIAPNNIIHKYGADVLRLYILSDTPCNRDFIWSEKSIISSKNLIKRLVSITEDYDKYPDIDIDIKEYIHKINIAMERYEFNVVIALIFQIIRSIENTIQSQKFPKKTFHDLLIFLYPFIPHSILEIWEKIKCNNIEKRENIWPIQFSYSKDKVSIIVQINGKKRYIINDVPYNTNKEYILDKCKSDTKICDIFNKNIKKIIYIHNKVINFVI